MIDEHAKVHRPSSLSRTIQCTGWTQLSMDIPDQETQSAREGTASHWVAEQMLHSVHGGDQTKLRMDFVNETAPNGVIVTDEMIDCAEFYVRDVLAVVNAGGLLRHMYIEQRLEIPQVHPDMFGTCDAFVWNPTTQTLYVWDYKYGHSSVLAEKNYQTIAYAMGAINLLGITPKSIVMRVVQPRCYDGNGAVREWVIDNDILMNHVRTAATKCAEADSFNPTLAPGKECMYCPARTRCTALKQSVANIIPIVESPITVDEPDSLWLSVEYDALTQAQKLLKARLDAIETEMMIRMTHGQNVPGYSMESSFSREQWQQEPAEIIKICKMMGVDPVVPDYLMTPNQVGKQLKKIGVDPSVISAYHAKERTGFKLVKDTKNKLRLIFKESHNG